MNDDLYQRVAEVGQQCDLPVPLDPSKIGDTIVPLADERTSVVEHVFHELGHAALLGVPLGPNLSKRISAHFMKALQESEWDTEAAQENEIQTFEVVMAVFDRLEIEYDRGVMVDALRVQLRDDLSNEEVYERWRLFRATEACTAAANRIVDLVTRENRQMTCGTQWEEDGVIHVCDLVTGHMGSHREEPRVRVLRAQLDASVLVRQKAEKLIAFIELRAIHSLSEEARHRARQQFPNRKECCDLCVIVSDLKATLL